MQQIEMSVQNLNSARSTFQDDDGKFLELQLNRVTIGETVVERIQSRSPPPAYQDSLKCGICQRERRGDSVARPLPCGHVYCLPCLTSYFAGDTITAASTYPKPQAAESFAPDLLQGTSAENIPERKESTAVNNVVRFCDICSQRGNCLVPAVSHCQICVKNYCYKHQQSHDDVMVDHQSTSISSVGQLPTKTTEPTHTCHRHPDQLFMMGCRTCNAILCAKCVDENASCPVKGTSHEISSLDAIVGDINGKLVPLKGEIEDRMARLVSLSSQCEAVIKRYDSETDDMLELMQQTKSQQVDAIVLNYSKLEVKAKQVRVDLRNQMVKFKETSIDSLLAELSTVQQKLGMAVVGDNHQTELITAYKEAKTLIQTIRDSGMPSLRLNGVVKMEVKKECRDIELRLAATNNISIVESNRQKQSLPLSLTRLRTFNLSHYTGAVCQHNGYTYVGLDLSGVGRIDKRGNLQLDFVAALDYVDSIVVYDNMLYVLMWQRGFRVDSYDMSGTLITSWSHPDRPVNNAKNKMAVLNGRIVIPLRAAKLLAVYSQYGALIKHVSCPLLELCCTDICGLDNDTLVICTYQTNTVFCINLNTTEVLWKCTEITRPRAVVCYGTNFLLVSTDVVPSEQIIHIINARNGEYLGSISEKGRDETKVTATVGKLSRSTPTVRGVLAMYGGGGATASSPKLQRRKANNQQAGAVSALTMNDGKRTDPWDIVIEHGTMVLDMEITDDTLLVSRPRENSLVVYELWTVLGN